MNTSMCIHRVKSVTLDAPKNRELGRKYQTQKLRFIDENDTESEIVFFSEGETFDAVELPEVAS